MNFGTKKWSTFFISPKGRQIVFAGAFASSALLFLGNYMPHTFLLHKYQNLVQNYRYGVDSQVPDFLLQRIEKSFDILDVSPNERKLMKPFMVYGFDIFQAGSTKFKSGSIIGIPENYCFTSATDVEKQEIRYNELINWKSDAGKLLQNAIILSEDEQVFSICKAILQLQTHKILLTSIYPPASFLIAYTAGTFLNQKMNLYAKSISVRLVLYSILALFGYGIWALLKDVTQINYDVYIDKKLCDLGPELIDAGFRFYGKILEKNMALRSLMNNSMYTSKGNENYFLRQKSLPISIRKSYFEMRRKNFSK